MVRRANIVQMHMSVVGESPTTQSPILDGTGTGAGRNIPNELTERQVRVGEVKRGGCQIVRHDVARGLEMAGGVVFVIGD